MLLFLNWGLDFGLLSVEISSSWNQVTLSVCPPFPQVHAEHHRRPVGVGGGLPVRPRGDAAGGQGEPAALPRGLRPERLGPLEPLQPGESSAAVWHRYANVRSPLRFILISSSCQKYFSARLEEFRAWQRCITVSSVWIFVNRLLLVHRGEIKEIYELGSREKWFIYHPYYTVVTVHSAGKEDDLW